MRLEYSFVFDTGATQAIEGAMRGDFEGFGDIFEAIERLILDESEAVAAYFDEILGGFGGEAGHFLHKLAKKDRRKTHLLKGHSSGLLKHLLSQNIICIEKTREPPPPPRSKHQRLKKSLRGYRPEDKVHFNSQFARFWFYFLWPHFKNSTNAVTGAAKKQILELIKIEFDHYCSLPFELACTALLARRLGIDKGQISSYWDRGCEIDIFAKMADFCIVGEAKYRGRKICKSVLTALLSKCEHAGIRPDIVALFSKNGFSEELLRAQSSTLLLFDLDDFKEIL